MLRFALADQDLAAWIIQIDDQAAYIYLYFHNITLGQALITLLYMKHNR